MGTLWLYAMPLDEVRAFFAASEHLVGELIGQAAEVVRDQRPAPLIGKIGPLFKHPIAPIMELPTPSLDDARALTDGRSLPPERLAPAWVIVRHWCDVRSVDKLTLEVDQKQLDDLDFCLVSRGLSSQFSVQTVLARDPRLPLRSAHGLKVGWMPNHHVAQAAEQWRDAVAECDVPAEGLAALRDQLAQFFGRFPSWTCDDAPPPDVLALFQ